MDFYRILELDPSASHDQIKRAYRRLALIHHPDKGGRPEEYHRVRAAYDTLSDPDRRLEYDRLNSSERLQLSKLLADYLDLRFPNAKYSRLLKAVLDSCYADPTELAEQVDNFDFPAIFSRITKTIFEPPGDADSPDHPELTVSDTPDAPTLRLRCRLADRYRNRYRKLTLGSDTVIIPLREERVWFDRPRLSVVVEPEPDPNFRVEGTDLHTDLQIGLKEYFSESTHKINLFGDDLEVTKPSLNGRAPELRLTRRGLPFSALPDSDDRFEEVDTSTPVDRGDLIIHFSVVESELP